MEREVSTHIGPSWEKKFAKISILSTHFATELIRARNAFRSRFPASPRGREVSTHMRPLLGQ